MAYKQYLCMAALMAALIPSLPAGAQNDSAASGAKGVIEEVMVRSKKKAVAESVQKVPSAITVLDASLISKTFSNDLTDVGRLAPNVLLQPVSTFPAFANFTIRGIGVNNSVRTVDPTVNIYQDGMVFGFQPGTVLDVFDLESIEILRGPQGILFGRNTTGGAVVLRTARPTGDTAIKGRVTLGNFNRVDLAASIEAPLGSDKVFGKLSVISRNQDGFFKDRNGGTFVPALLNPSGLQPDNPEQNQADIDTIVVKPTLVFNISDDFDLTLLGSYTRMRGGSSATNAGIPEGTTPLSLALWGYTPPEDFYELNHDILGRNETDAWHLIGEANWDLGHGVLTSITAYRDIKYNNDMDIDGTPFVLVHFPDNRESGDQFSQEIRYASTFSDEFDFVVGLYYFTQDYSVLERRILFGGLDSPEQAATHRYFQGEFDHEQETFAGFANINWHITDELTFNVGGRYTWEEKEIDIQTLAPCVGQTFAECPTERNMLRDSWDNFSPSAGIKYQFAEDSMVYFQWTRGFRSGNFNGRATSLPAVGPTAEERVDSFEFGVKSTFMDGRARINAAIFRTDYKDIQRTVLLPVAGNPVQTLNNAAQATIDGIELEIIFTPVEALRFEANLGWIDAQYDEFLGVETDGIPGITAEDNALAALLEFDRVPELTLYLAATYFIPVDYGEWSIRMSYSWRDSQFSDVNNTPSLAQGSYGLLDASIGLDMESYRVSIFGRNLTDEAYFDIRSTGLSYPAYGGQPRTWGIEISASL